jgi:hypothetical protein
MQQDTVLIVPPLAWQDSAWKGMHWPAMHTSSDPQHETSHDPQWNGSVCIEASVSSQPLAWFPSQST